MDKAILIGANIGKNNMIDYSMDELKSLAKAKNIDVVYSLTQSINKINAPLYIGSGKVDEIRMFVENLEADMVIFNNELSGSQIRNLEARLDCRVIDRTLLILDIFASRARTREAMIQVEIAQLDYMLPRLTGLRESLNRQQGGIGSKGPGEKKLELDRRKIESERSKLLQELKTVEKSRRVQRKTRNRSAIKKVAIVGYTNSGKSTLTNALVKVTNREEDKNVLVKNMLFATLETATRNIKLSNNKEFIITDTVGFVSDLPHDLIESFKSTLEEIKEADLLLHLVDASNIYHENQIEVTNETLKEIGVHDIATIYIYNKMDAIDHPVEIGFYPNLSVSVHREKDVKSILELIEKELFKDYETIKLLIPFDQGEIVHHLNENSTIISTDYSEKGTILTLELSQIQKGKYSKYII